MTRTVSVLFALAVLAACNPLAEIPFQGLHADNQGLAGWNADGTGPELARTGHPTPWGACASASDALYYLASRDFPGIDPLSARGIHFVTPVTGFANFLDTLATHGFSINDLTMTWGLQTLGADQEGSDWSYASPLETRFYTGGQFTIKLAGEDMVGGPMPPTTVWIMYDIANCLDEQISATTEFVVPILESANSSTAVQAAAAAFLSDLFGRSIRFSFDSHQPAVGLSPFGGDGRGGAFFDITTGKMLVR